MLFLTSFKVRAPHIFESSSHLTNRRRSAALLIYVSAVFVSKGIYTFSMVMQVYSLILFSVTFASQFLDFGKSMYKTMRRVYVIAH